MRASQLARMLLIGTGRWSLSGGRPALEDQIVLRIGETAMRLEVKMSRDSGGEFRAWCPSLPGCAIRAASVERARQDISEAICGYVASLNGSGQYVLDCDERLAASA